MVKRKVLEVTKYLQQCLKETGLNISKIILFGSQSKEEATEESDIDIAIISKDFIGKDIFERAHMTKDAEINTIKKFMLPLDIVTLTTEEFENETSPIAEYTKKGKVMYAA
ncbi:MAG: nucleotidyltransferase domain-containing protein [Methanosarcinales archaeon]|nr:nucleotidyltransferase domain-containing protein [Methanosarcinales archaeon]